jgi:uncharacterized NAD(P)/FAD-binding protein YdhS
MVRRSPYARPFWDVHRHRIAPAIADQIDDRVAQGRLEFCGGKPQQFDEHPDKVVVHWRPRGSASIEQMDVAQIINCTGPQGDVLRSEYPHIVQMLADGHIPSDRQLPLGRRRRTIAAALFGPGGLGQLA